MALLPIGRPICAAFTGVFHVGCGEALTVTEADRTECDVLVSKLVGRAAFGEEVAQAVHNRNGVKSIRLVYPPTKDFPGAQCDIVQGKVMSIVQFKTIYTPPKGAT